MSEWQPIETAPMDGTKILVANGDGYIALSWWMEKHSAFNAGTDRYGPYSWTTHGSSALKYWMPLPPPPKE